MKVKLEELKCSDLLTESFIPPTPVNFLKVLVPDFQILSIPRGKKHEHADTVLIFDLSYVTRQHVPPLLGSVI